jgi:predicted nucleic acid-binding protein
VHADRHEAFECFPIHDGQWRGAFEAQRVVARTGRHGALGIADVLTAVLSAEHGMTVLHYDSDFEISAEVLDFER